MPKAASPISDVALKALKPKNKFYTVAVGGDGVGGLQTCSLKVASDDGGFLVLAQTAGNGPKLEPGMLVAWQAGTYSADIGKVNSEDQRFGWVGLIIAVLHPDLDIKKGWAIHASFNFC